MSVKQLAHLKNCEACIAYQAAYSIVPKSGNSLQSPKLTQT